MPRNNKETITQLQAENIKLREQYGLQMISYDHAVTLLNSCEAALKERNATAMKLQARVDELEDLWALLGSGGYETGSNSDLESEETHVIYQVTGGYNDREFTQKATGKSPLEAMQNLKAALQEKSNE